MKCILTIGYESILLPDHKGIEKIIDTLSKGILCSRYFGHRDEIELQGDVEVGFKILSPSIKFTVSEEMEEKFAQNFKQESSSKQGRKAISGKKVLSIEHKQPKLY